MLHAREAGRYAARCDRCGTVVKIVDTNLDAARADLQKRGWREGAPLGDNREGAAWWCANCAAKGK